MKKLFLSLLFLLLTSFIYSQEEKQEPKKTSGLGLHIKIPKDTTNSNLSTTEKQELRRNHTTGLQFKSTKDSTVASSKIKITDSSEEKETKVTTHVKYYQGTEDSTYKEFKYIKPE